jgi:cytochrome c556
MKHPVTANSPVPANHFVSAKRPVPASHLASAKHLTIAVSLIFLAIGSAVASEPGAPAVKDVIEARHVGFKKMGAAMKEIGAQLKTDAPDLPKMTAAAQAIDAGAKQQPNWFPPGSGPESGAETDALPHIWKDTSKFSTLSGELATEAGNLSSALASKDVAAIRTQFKVLSDVCSTCHKSFRAD